MDSTLTSVDAQVEHAVARLDLERLEVQYWEQGEFLFTNREMGRAQRAVSNLKDAFAYFGVRSLWQGRARRRQASGR